MHTLARILCVVLMLDGWTCQGYATTSFKDFGVGLQSFQAKCTGDLKASTGSGVPLPQSVEDLLKVVFSDAYWVPG